jgi:hypothetical protein
MSRKRNGETDGRLLRDVIARLFWIGFPELSLLTHLPRGIPYGLPSGKGHSGKTHHTARLGDIAKFGRTIEKSDPAPDDV